MGELTNKNAFRSELWYCWKCREEMILKYPDTEENRMRSRIFRTREVWWLRSEMEKPLSELTEDPNRKGYYLCDRHRKAMQP